MQLTLYQRQPVLIGIMGGYVCVGVCKYDVYISPCVPVSVAAKQLMIY